MARLLVTRLLRAFLTLGILSVIVFSAIELLPGDAAVAILGRDATPKRLEVLRKRLELDQPPARRYFQWVSGVVSGDLGPSLVSDRPISELLSGRFEHSLVLLVISATISVPIGVALGIVSAVWKDSVFDRITTTVTLALVALPVFVVGLSLVFLLATGVFRVLPPTSLLISGETGWRRIRTYILPASTLILATSPYISRMLRTSMIEVLESEYVQMARLKGLPDRLVIGRHALPNAIIPTIQVTALNIAWMAGGVVVVEYVFQYPGIGWSLVDAVANRDIYMVQAITLLIASIYIGMNLLADVATIVLSPRLRTSL
jgi:peptide/nickel transport system permease protein